MCCSTVFWSAYVLMRILLILNFVLYITCPFSLTALRILSLSLVFPGGSVCQESTCNAGDLGLIPGSGSSLEKDMATHSRILAWRISWTEEPGRLQSMGSQRAGHDWATTSSPRHLFSVVWLGCAFMCFHVFFFLRFAKFFRSVGWWFSFMMENSWSWLLQLLLLLHPLPYFSEFPLTYGPPDAKSLQSCPTLCDPIGGSPQALPSLGFSRQEHWSGVPLPSDIAWYCPTSHLCSLFVFPSRFPLWGGFGSVSVTASSASSGLLFFSISSVIHPILCIFQTWKFYWDLFFISSILFLVC